MHFDQSVGLRLLQLVFGCYFVVALVVTTIQMWFKHLNAKERIFHEPSNLAETTESTQSNAVWRYDLTQLESAFVGMSKISIVSGIRITTVEGQVRAEKYNGVLEDPASLPTKNIGVYGQVDISKIAVQTNGDTVTKECANVCAQPIPSLPVHSGELDFVEIPNVAKSTTTFVETTSA